MLVDGIPPLFRADDVIIWDFSQQSGNPQSKVTVHVNEPTTDSVECTLAEQPRRDGTDLGFRSLPESSGSAREMSDMRKPTFVSPGKAPCTKWVSLQERSPTGVGDFAVDIAITP
jgi:hypothetical protein